MPLGTEVDLILGPGHTVLRGAQLSRGKGHSIPLFSAHVHCAKRSPTSATAELLFNLCSVLHSQQG